MKMGFLPPECGLIECSWGAVLSLAHEQLIDLAQGHDTSTNESLAGRRQSSASVLKDRAFWSKRPIGAVVVCSVVSGFEVR